MGLACAEKKRLFYPGAKYGRKLRPGETPWLEKIKEKTLTEVGIGDSMLTDNSLSVSPNTMLARTNEKIY